MAPRKIPNYKNRTPFRAVLCTALLVVLCAGLFGCGGAADATGTAGVTGNSAAVVVDNSAAGASGGSSVANASGGSGRCTIEIDCKTLLDHRDQLKSSKVSLVPADGILLAEQTVAFKNGETVFDVLARVCKDGKLPMEFTGAAVSGGAYVEGIGNLYEFDAGPGSGWRYSVNGDYPGQSSSLQKLKNGDAICWRYTCDLGADVGASGAQK